MARAYFICPRCGSSEQRDYHVESLGKINCGGCLMSDVEIVELVVDRVRILSAEDE